jgi:hypothetical protein
MDMKIFTKAIDLNVIILNNNIMSKIKNLSDLGALYGMVQENASNQPLIESGNKQPDILNTNTAMYLSESSEGKMPKAGSAFGNEDGKEKLAKGTGPEAAGYFKKNAAKEKQDAAEETDKEKEDREAAHESKPEKMEENVDSASKSPKYKKQSFTMPKSKFQKLYEDAINSGPFVNEEEEMTPVAPAADHEMGGEEPAMDHEMGDEETHMTHEEAIEAVEKLLAFLKKDMEHDVETGTLGDEDQAEEGHMGHMEEDEEEESTMEEAIDAEEMGHALVDGKSEELKDGHKIHKAGSGTLAKNGSGAAKDQNGPKGQDGAASKAKESAHLKDGHKLHTAGTIKKGDLFDQ